MFKAPDSDLVQQESTTGFIAPESDRLPDEPKTFGGLAENMTANLGRMINPLNLAHGLADQIKTGAYDLPKEATDTLAQAVGSAVTGEPLGETPMAKRASDLAASEMVQKPLDYAYKNPLDTAGLLATPFIGFTEGGAGAARSSPIGSLPPELEMLPAGPRPTRMISPAQNTVPIVDAETVPARMQDPIKPALLEEPPKAGPKIGADEGPQQQTPPGAAPEPETPPTSGEPEIDPFEQAKEYVGNKYKDFASKPGRAEKIADYIQEKSQQAAVQQLGGSPGKARQLGKTPQEINTALRAIGQYALDNGLVGPTVSENEMLARHAQLLKAAGDKLGQLRAEADTLRSPMDDIDVLQQVRAKLDKKFERGAASTGKSAYQNALQDLEDSDASFEGLAKTATDLNHEANKANKINQPHTPYTEVANEISRINNERIKSTLGPEKAAQYEQALNHFGVNKKIGEFLKTKVTGGIKRMGPGSLTRNLAQSAMDEFGYRAGAKLANRMATSIKKNPNIASSIPSMFKEFINQVEDIGSDVQGMWEGGVVDPKQQEMTNYLQPKFPKAQSRSDSLYDKIVGDPELSRWAPAFQDAAARGPQAVTSTHFVLMQKDPEYNSLFNQRMNPS